MKLKTSKSKEQHKIAMSTASEKKFVPNSSQGDFWGGTMVDGFPYKLAVFFLGLLGLDKLALRSPLTAAFKFIINVLTWGSWWVYDMIQSYTDTDFVTKYGMSTPFGPDGHGYNLIEGFSSMQESSFKPGLFGLLLYYIYVIGCILFPYGFNSILAGDTTGGLIKLISCMAIITIPVYFLLGLFEYATSGTVEKDGIPRTFPVHPFIMLEKSYPAAFILPTEQKDTLVAAYDTRLKERVANGEQPILQGLFTSIVNLAEKGLNEWPPFKAFKTVSAASDGVQAASDTAKAVGEAIKKKVTQNPDAVADKLLGITAQKGGSLETKEMDTLVLAGIAVLVLGGFAAAFLRKITFPRRTDDNERPRKAYERDDSPPVPGGI